MSLIIAILIMWPLVILWILRIARLGAQHRDLGDAVARRRFQP